MWKHINFDDNKKPADMKQTDKVNITSDIVNIIHRHNYDPADKISTFCNICEIPGILWFVRQRPN